MSIAASSGGSSSALSVSFPASAEPLVLASTLSIDVQALQNMAHLLGKDQFLIQFSDSVEVYHLSQIDGLHYFATRADFMKAAGSDIKAKIVQIPEYDHDIFTAVLALIVDKKPLHQAIPGKLLNDPDLYEHLVEAINYFHQDNNQLIQSIKKSLPALITLSRARAILSEVDTNMAISKELGGLDVPDVSEKTKQADKSEKQERVESFCKAIAKQKMRQALAFKTLEEAEKHFECICYCQEGIERVQHTMALQEAACARHLMASYIPLADLEKKRVEESIAAYQAKMGTLLERVDLTNIKSLKIKKYLATHIDHKDLETRTIALKAKMELEAYRKEVTGALRIQGADLTRVDLLASILGLDESDEFIFEYYSLSPYYCVSEEYSSIGSFHYNGEGQRSRSFSYGPSQYNLKNNSIKDFEAEIRCDLERQFTGVKLPPQLIDKQTVTKPLSKEVEALKEKIVPVLKGWEAASIDSRNEVAQILIDHWKWSENITTADLRIEPWGLEKTGITFIKLEKYFKLNLVDCSTVYLGWDQQPGSCPNPHTLVDMPSFEELRADYSHRFTTSTHFVSVHYDG